MNITKPFKVSVMNGIIFRIASLLYMELPLCIADNVAELLYKNVFTSIVISISISL